MAKKEKLKTNFLYSVSYQILVIILPLITAPYVTRKLGAELTGTYSITQAFANYFYLFAMLGINNYGNREIARTRDNRAVMSRTFWEMFAFQICTGVIMTIAYLVYCVFFLHVDKLFYLLQIFYVMSGMFDVNWFCFGIEKFKLTTVRNTIIRLLSAVCVFLFVRDNGDLPVYTFILSMSFLVGAIAIWPFVLKQVDFVRPDWAGIKRHIKPNLVLFWPVFAVSLYNVMDKLMLGWMSTKQEASFYSNAERTVQMPYTLILALDNVIMPRMSNIFAKGDQKGARVLMDTVMYFTMFASGGMAFGLAGVGQVFAPWFYGEEFVRCGYFILLLSPILIFKSWAGVLRTQYIIPTGKDKIYISSLTAGAIVNLISNFFLIPRLQGTGAVIGTLLAEFSVAAIQFFLTRKDIPVGKYLKNGFIFCILGSIMFAGVYAIRWLGLGAFVTIMLQVFTGGVIYLIIASFYMVKIDKNPVIINEVLKMLHIKKRL